MTQIKYLLLNAKIKYKLKCNCSNISNKAQKEPKPIYWIPKLLKNKLNNVDARTHLDRCHKNSTELCRSNFPLYTTTNDNYTHHLIFRNANIRIQELLSRTWQRAWINMSIKRRHTVVLLTVANYSGTHTIHDQSLCVIVQMS